MANKGSFIKNTGQSIKFGVYNVLRDKNPAVTDLYDTNKEYISEIADTLKSLRKGQFSLIKALNKIGPNLGDVVSAGAKNTIADAKHFVKTGKIPGLDGSDVKRGGTDVGGTDIAMEGDEYDLGEDDFNFDELDAALKGDDAASIKDSVALKSDAASIAATNRTTESVLNLGQTVGKGFGAMGSAIGKQTSVLTGSIMNSSKASAKMHAQMISMQVQSTTQLTAHLKMVNDNLANMVSFQQGAMQQHFATSAQFYNDAITELRKVSTGIEMMTGGPKKQREEYVTDFDKVFNSNGTLNLREYAKVIGTNLEKTEIGSMILPLINNPEALAQFARAPGAYIAQWAIGSMVPTIVEKSMKTFNESLSAFFPALMSKFNQMAGSDNPILATIGTLLGVESPGGSARLSDYEKGAVPFDGITRKAIVDVIPSYLSKMLAVMTGTQERIFDYNQGVFKTMNEIREEFQTREYMEREQALGGGQKILDEILEEIAFENERQRESFKEAVDAFKTALTKKDFTNFNSEADIAEIAELMGNFDMYDEDGNPIGTTNELAQFLAAQIRNRTSRSQQMKMASAKARKGSISQRNYASMEAAGDVSLYHLNNRFTDEDLAGEMPFTGSFASGGKPGFFRRIFTRGGNKQALAYDQNGNPIIVSKGETIVPASGSTIEMTGKGKGEAAFAYALMNNAYGDMNRKFDQLINIQRSMLSKQTNQAPRVNRNMSVQEYYDQLDQEYYEKEEDLARRGDQEGLKKLRDERNKKIKEEEDQYVKNMDEGMVTFEEIMQDSGMALRTHGDWRREQMEKMGKSIEKNEFDKYMERYLKEDDKRNREFSFKKWIEKPSSILADTINVIDDTLYRVLFGAKPEEDSLIEVLIDNFQGIFRSVKNWLIEDIFKPVKNFLFGEDFFKTKVFKLLSGAKDLAAGEEDEEGVYHGGFASDVANEFGDLGKGAVHLFTGKGYTDSKGRKVASTTDSVFAAMNDTFKMAGGTLKNYMFGENKGKRTGGSNFTEGWGKGGFSLDDLEMSDAFANELTGIDGTPDKVVGHKSKGGWAQKTGFYNLTKGEFVVPRYLAKRVPKLMAALTGSKPDNAADAADLAGSTVEEAGVSGLQQSLMDLRQSIDRVSGEKVLAGALLPKEMKEELIAEQAASAAEYMETNQRPFIDLFTEKVMGSVGSFAAMLSGSTNYEQAAVQTAYLKTIREKAPNVIANSIVGTAGLLAAKWAGLGLLGTMISPMGAAALATTLSIAHSSERFKSYLYGDLDEQTGKRMGGIIPDTVKDFFRENKTGMVGGALMGMIGGITGITPLSIATGLLGHLPIVGGAVSAGAGALGFLPSLALGITGPVLMGAAVGTALRSKRFQEIMYGAEAPDGGKVGGLMNSEFMKSAKKLLPDTMVGAALGHIAFGGLGAMVSGIPGLGLLGSMALTPYMGAIAGGAIGMAMGSQRFNEWMFGKQDKNGVFTEGGMMHVVQNWFTHEIFKPIGAFAHKSMLRFEDFIVEDILLPASKVVAPLEVLALRTFDTVKEFVTALFTDTKSLIMKILRPAINVLEKVVTTTAKIISSVGNTMFDLVTGIAGTLISLPFKLLGAGGKTLEFLERRTGSTYIDILDEANEKYKERKSSYKERKKERWEDFKISEKERLADRKQARLDNYAATEDQLAAMTARNQKELALLKDHDLAVKQASLAQQSVDTETGILSKVTAIKDFFVGKGDNAAAAAISGQTPAQQIAEQKEEQDQERHGEVVYELKELGKNLNKSFGVTDLLIGWLKRMSLQALVRRLVYKPLIEIRDAFYDFIGKDYEKTTAYYGGEGVNFGGGLFGRAKGWLHRGLTKADQFASGGVTDGSYSIFGKAARGMALMQRGANAGVSGWRLARRAGRGIGLAALRGLGGYAAEEAGSSILGNFFGNRPFGGIIPRTGLYGLSQGEMVIPRALARGFGSARARMMGLASSAMEENAVLGLNQTIRELVDAIKSSQFSSLGEYLKTIADNTKSSSRALAEMAGEGFGAASDLADGVTDSVKNFGKRSAGYLRNLFSEQDYRKEIVTRLKEISGNTAEAIKEKKNGLFDTIKKWLDGATTFLFTLLGGAGIGGLITAIMSWGTTFSAISDKLDDILVFLGLKKKPQPPPPGANQTHGFTAHRTDFISSTSRYGRYTLNKFLNRKGIEAGFKADRGFFGATAGDKYLSSQIDDVTGFFKGRFGSAEDMLNEGIRQEGKAARYSERANELRQKAIGKRNWFGWFGEGAELTNEAERLERKAAGAMEKADNLLGRAAEGDSTVSKAYAWVKTHASSAIDAIANSATIRKIMSKTGLDAFVEFLKKTLKAVTESAIAKNISGITKVIGEFATAPASAVAFGIYDAYRGFRDAGEMLGIRPDEVTYSMRTAVAAYEALINLPMAFGWFTGGVGAVPVILDLLMTIAYSATSGSFNPKAYLLGKMVEIMDKVLFGKETNMAAKRDRFEQGFAEWQKTHGGDRDAYYAELDEGRHEVLDDLRNAFGGNNSAVAKSLFGEVDEEGKLVQHGALSGFATNPLQTLLGFATGGVITPENFGAVSDGRFVGGKYTNTGVGSFVNKTLATIFGEADLKNGYKGQANIFSRLYNGTGEFVSNMVTNLEAFQQRAIQTRKEQGPLMGSATVLFNMVRGMFGLEYTETPIGDAWNSFTTTVGDVFNSGMEKVNFLVETLENFQQNARETIDEQGPLMGTLNIMFNGIRGMFGLDYKKDALQDAYGKFAGYMSGFYKSMQQRMADFYTWMEDGLTYLRKTTIKDMIKDAVQALIFDTKGKKPEMPKPGEVGGEHELTDGGNVEDDVTSYLDNISGNNKSFLDHYLKGRGKKGGGGKLSDYNKNNGGDAAMNAAWNSEQSTKRKGIGKSSDVVSFSQSDARWKNKPISGDIPMYGSFEQLGCAPTVFASVMATDSHKTIDPAQAAKLSDARSLSFGRGRGYTPAYFAQAARSLGKKFSLLDKSSPRALISALRSGKSVIAGGKGARMFTPNGHYTQLKGLKYKDGKYYTTSYDPIKSRGVKEYSINEILGSVSNGGPDILGVVGGRGGSGYGWIGGGESMADFKMMDEEQTKEYTDNIGISSEPLDPGAPITLPFYKQGDPRWGDNEYPFSNGSTGNSYAASACGPTTMAMLSTWARGQAILPTDTGSYAAENGFHVDGGTCWDFFDDFAQTLGFRMRQTESQSDIQSALDKKYPVIASVDSPSPFTGASHFILYAGARPDGSWIVYDPNRRMPDEGFDPDEAMSTFNAAWIPEGDGFGKGQPVGTMSSSTYKGTGGKGGKSGARRKRNLSLLDRIREGWSKISSDVTSALLSGKEYKGTDMSFLDWEGDGAIPAGSSTSGSSQVLSNLQGDSNAEKIWSGLKKGGLSDEAVAGIMGNIKQESSYDPTATNEYGYHGLVQWDPHGRWPAAKSWITANGLDPDSIEGQVSYILDEAPRRYEAMGDDYGAFKTAQSVPGATHNWAETFEGYTGELSNRNDYAQEAYSSFAGKGGGGLSNFFGDGLYGAGGGGLAPNLSAIDVGRMAEMARQQAEAMSDVLSAEAKSMPYNTDDWKIGGITQTALIDSIRSIDIHDEAHQMINYLSQIAEYISAGGYGKPSETVIRTQVQEQNQAKKEVLKEAFGNSNTKAARHRSNPTDKGKLLAIAKGSGFA